RAGLDVAVSPDGRGRLADLAADRVSVGGGPTGAVRCAAYLERCLVVDFLLLPAARLGFSGTDCALAGDCQHDLDIPPAVLACRGAATAILGLGHVRRRTELYHLATQ